MPEPGYSGNKIPTEYGQAAPFYRKAAFFVAPAAALAAALTLAGTGLANSCRVAGQLGAAYALGSNAWLFKYGPTMFNVCTSVGWLGKEGFSTIQASLFPDYFALQTASCMIALGGHVGAMGGAFDKAAWLMSAAMLCAMVNLFALGPKTTSLMLVLYNGPSEVGNGLEPLLDKEEASKAAKKKFGMVHGISMLVNLLNLAAVAGYIVIVACK
eukprot:CAMPEP_0180607952 /NCGR_PEP_ID=MMETSP1037_2-20121125/27986_1 /TAXON_ID=632150 /ORGANISM="Azadinium spinosum, Strain 3D9" /LENGTH=212 /DNA_ID=CAMNT_0022627289 /DNA_START=51 /DNA_END=689 /DNA_ORIENTATION=+